MLDQLRSDRVQASYLHQEAKSRTKTAVTGLRQLGLCYRDVGYLLGISHEQARQIDRNVTQ